MRLAEPRHLLISALLLLAGTGVACWGAAQEAPAAGWSLSETHGRADETELKDRNRARLLSAAATLGPLMVASAMQSDTQYSPTQNAISGGLVTAGLLVGPSVGSIYADDWSTARRGMLIRAGGGALAATGTLAFALGALGGSEGAAAVGVVLAAGGAGVVAGSAVNDIVRSSARSVDRHNEAVRASTSVSVAPWMPEDGGAGVQLRFSF